MGGMGRQFDGGYTEYTCVPAKRVQLIQTELAWETLGAIPEMLQMSWGSLFKSLRLEKGDRLLIRGGTTSVGLAAAAIVKSHGAFVADRRTGQGGLCRGGRQSARTGRHDDLEGFAALRQTTWDRLHDPVSSATNGLSTISPYRGDPDCSQPDPLPANRKILCGLRSRIWSSRSARAHCASRSAKSFTFDEIVEAHRCTEENKAGGKIVVLT
jgi:hypothetical protein